MLGLATLIVTGDCHTFLWIALLIYTYWHFCDYYNFLFVFLGVSGLWQKCQITILRYTARMLNGAFEPDGLFHAVTGTGLLLSIHHYPPLPLAEYCLLSPSGGLAHPSFPVQVSICPPPLSLINRMISGSGSLTAAKSSFIDVVYGKQR